MTQITGIEVQLKAARQAEADSNRLEKSLDRLGKSGTKAEGTFDRLRRETSKMGGGFEGLKRQIFSLQGALATLGVGISFGAAVNEIASFGREMSVVQAVSRATASDMEKLTATARELGATTGFSASEAAQGLVALSQAGFSAEQSLAAIRDTLNLAAAGGIGLGEAADLATNTLSQFNLAANEAGRVADVLAESAARSNTSVGELGIAMRQVGPVAASVGVSFENTTAAISALSDAGLKGEQAGTGLRAVLASLVDPSKEAAGVIERLGVNVSDLSDPAQVFEQFGKAGMTAQDAVKIFGREAAAAGLILAGASDKVAELAGEFRNAEGAAAQMAKTMEDNLGGDIKTLSSAMSELILQTGDKGLTGALRSATQAITELFRVASGATTFSDFRKEFQLLTDTAIALSVVMGARLVSSLTASAQATFVSIAAQRAHSLALVEDASRTVASTAAKLAFNNMLVAEAQASVAAATGLSRLTVVQNTLLPAQTRAAAAAAAHTAALQAQAAAASKASISAGLLRGSLALLGGPVGAAVVAAGAFALLVTNTSQSAKAADLAREANDELQRVLSNQNATEEAIRKTIELTEKRKADVEATLLQVEAEAERRRAFANLVSGSQGQLGSAADVSAFAAEGKVEKIRKQLTALNATSKEAAERLEIVINGPGGISGGPGKTESSIDKIGESTKKATRELTAMEQAQAKLTKALAEYEGRQMVREIEEEFRAQEKVFTEGARLQEEAQDKVNRKLEESKQFVRDLGLTFSSSFEEAILKANSLSDVLKGLAQDILAITTRKMVTNPLAAAIGNIAGGLDLGGLFGGGTAAPTAPHMFGPKVRFAHQGGIIGVDSMPMRSVSPSIFDNAPRLHNGGLLSGEIPAILKRGEEVLPANHPRHQNNQNNQNSNVQIQIIDQRSADSPPVQVTQSQGPNGMQQFKVLIVETMKQSMGTGELDRTFANNFGLRRPGVSR